MARSGSDDSISRQNLRLINNKPLIYYIIKTSLQQKNSTVIVSTDSEEIKEVSKMYGAQVISRPKKLTKNSTMIKEICLDTLNKLNSIGDYYEYCLVLHPKIPLIKLKTISKFFNLVQKNSGTFFGISTIVDSKYAYNKINKNNFLELKPMSSDIALLNKIVCFKVKNFIQNNGKFIRPYYSFKIPKDELLSLSTYNDFGTFEQILLKRKILVRIDSSKIIGMGHVYNMLTILNHFRNDEILIVMQKNLNLGIKKFKDHLFDVTLFSSMEEFEKIIKKFQPDIIFNDILNTDKNYMRRIVSNYRLIVNFEDMGQGRQFADLVFNPIFNIKKPISNEFFGGNYACVRDEFRLFTNSIIQKNVKKVVISFGGTDQKNLTGKTIDIIRKNNFKNIEFIVILGYGFSHTEKVKQKIIKLNKQDFQFILVEKSDFLAQYVRDVDFAIVSNGRTVFEFASMKIPLVSVSVNTRESLHSFIKDEKIGINFSYNHSTYEQNLNSAIKQLMVFSERKFFKHKLEKLKLLDGVDRVVSIINNKFNEKSLKTNHFGIK